MSFYHVRSIDKTELYGVTPLNAEYSYYFKFEVCAL